MNNSLQNLVNAYCDSPAPGLHNAIITEAMPLVKSIIGKINRPDTPLTQYEDIESVAIMGLLQSLNSFRKDKNIQFNTYAFYRIKGSIIDYLRKIDEMPRSQRITFGKAQSILGELTQKLGREPSENDMAHALDMSVDDYRKLLSNVQQRIALSLDDTKYQGDVSGSLSDFIPDMEIDEPDAELNRQSINQKLQSSINKLKERDRFILALYYFEDLTLNEIAKLLSLTEARISQIIGKALLHIRSTIDI